jgi:hypothetical protein
VQLPTKLPAHQNSHNSICVPSQEFRNVLADFSSQLDTDGRLSLYFPDVYPIAGFFLLLRLKRQGFSESRATVKGKGIILSAQR